MQYKAKYRARKQFNLSEVTPDHVEALRIIRHDKQQALEIVLAYLQDRKKSSSLPKTDLSALILYSDEGEEVEPEDIKLD